MESTKTLNALVKELTVGIMNALLYFPEHARVKESIRQVLVHLETLAESGISFPLTIGVADDKIIHDGRPLLGASFYAKKLITAIAERKTGGLRFERTTEEKDVRFLFEVLARRTADGTDHRTLNARLELEEIDSIRFVAPLEEVAQGQRDELWNTLDDLRVVQVPVDLYQNMVDLLQTSAIRAARSIEIEMDRIYDVAVEVLRLLHDDPETLLLIASQEDSDDYNLRHSIRVCLRTCLVMQDLVEDHDLLLRICRAALLHDIGKALVPPEILFKPDTLTPDERLEMEKHPEHGARILLAQRDPDPLVVRVAFAHHIMHDGRGYPRLPGPFPVDPITQVLQICDVFEALCAHRPYKNAYTPRKAFQIMLDMRGCFHPGLFAHFIRSTGLYPLGTVLQLNSGEIGQVIHGALDFYTPRVRILCTADGKPVAPDERPEFDLVSTDPTGELTIERILHSPNLIEGLLV